MRRTPRRMNRHTAPMTIFGIKDFADAYLLYPFLLAMEEALRLARSILGLRCGNSEAVWLGRSVRFSVEQRWGAEFRPATRRRRRPALARGRRRHPPPKL